MVLPKKFVKSLFIFLGNILLYMYLELNFKDKL